MRPRRLADYVGQAKIVGPGTLLRRIIEADRLGSVILYGPPGVGKTTLAEIIARETKRRFVELSATASGVKDVRDVLEAARRRLEDDGQRTCLFIDEIHRYSKAQQDVLLPDVESGVVALIGATTQNPFFALTSALVSRSRIFELESLGAADVAAILDRAVADREHGLGGARRATHGNDAHGEHEPPARARDAHPASDAPTRARARAAHFSRTSLPQQNVGSWQGWHGSGQGEGARRLGVDCQ
jgi:replication-associated recombination protein RarA